MDFADRIRSLPTKWMLAVLGVVAVCVLVFGGLYIYRSKQFSGLRPLVKTVTIAGFGGEIGEPFGVVTRGGEVFISDGEKGIVWQIAADGSLKQFAAGLDTPSAIVYLGNDLLVADSGSNSIKRVTPDGKTDDLAGVAGAPGFADGDAAAAKFSGPIGIAVADAKVYVADSYNDRIRVIENGRVTTLAGGTRGFADGAGVNARFDTPTGLAVVNGRLIVADTGNRRLRVVEPDGTTWTLAGDARSDLRDGLLSEAVFGAPSAIASDAAGSLYVADGNAIRMITSGVVPLVTTISNGGRGLADGGAIRSRFNRPSGLAVDSSGELLVADSENRLVRRISVETSGEAITKEQIDVIAEKPGVFRKLQPARWPYDPPAAKRDIAGTLAEIRGEVKPDSDQIWYHNGLDIAGNYGETARFVRDEKVLRPLAVDNFGSLRESVRMPTLGYIHIRLGRNVNNMPFGDPRFRFTADVTGKLTDVRIARGTRFRAGEPIGTLNSMNHVHLVAGRSGSEMNALDALTLPGIADSRPPTIEKVTLTDENSRELETKPGLVRLTGKTRIVVRAYDQVDGNAERRRLGVYQVGYQILHRDLTPAGDQMWTIRFDRLPAAGSIRLVYADGSKSGATGETIFSYIATNRVDGDSYREDFLDAAAIAPGEYVLRVSAGDYFGNSSHKDIAFEISR